MATTTKGDFHASFVVMNQAAIDLASLGAVASVDQDIAVEALDGIDQFPLMLTDFVLGWQWGATLAAGLAVQTAKVKDSATITVRITNASAGAIDNASVAANTIYFFIGRR